MDQPSNQPARGCLEAGLTIVLLCGFWCVFLGPKGILLGLAQYFVVRFALFFRDVFAPTEKIDKHESTFEK